MSHPQRSICQVRGRAPRCARTRVAVASLALGLLAGAAQPAEPTADGGLLAAVNESTPVGQLPSGERRPGWQGWFADAWEGSKRIFRDGRSDLLLPVHTLHPGYKYPNRAEQNNYPWGAGVTRTVIDGSDNERIVYLLGFADSHADFQPMAGYAWVARWPLAAGLKAGLGYTVLVTARADANYIPFPVALPLVSLGTDEVTLYALWTPTADVLFFFARFSLHEKGGAAGDSRSAHMSFGAPDGADRPRPNLVYGAAARVGTDASGIDSVASGNAWGPLAGYRRLLTHRLAVDVSVSRSGHTLDLNGERIGRFDVVPLAVTAQYHFPDYHGLRMYAGGGIAYTTLAQRETPGYRLEAGSVSPVMQVGASYRLTDTLVLTGGLSANFTRNTLSRDGVDLGTIKLFPVVFSLGLGYAF